MKTLNESIVEYKIQLQKGDIQLAYKGIMQYLLYLRNHFASNYPDYFVSGNIYFGYMDMSYFAVTPKALANEKLKIAIVFLHDQVKFEVWLAAANKEIQSKYWRFFKDKNWNIFRLPDDPKNADSILESDLCVSPDFEDNEKLTKQIENATQDFTQKIIDFLKYN